MRIPSPPQSRILNTSGYLSYSLDISFPPISHIIRLANLVVTDQVNSKIAEFPHVPVLVGVIEHLHGLALKLDAQPKVDLLPIRNEDHETGRNA